MTRSQRILKRVSRALDRAIRRQTPTGSDCWAVGWSRAYKAALRRESRLPRGIGGVAPDVGPKGRNGMEVSAC